MTTSHGYSNDTSGCADTLSTMSMDSCCEISATDPIDVDRCHHSVNSEDDSHDKSKQDDTSANSQASKAAFVYDPTTQLRIGCYVVMKTLGEGAFAKVKCE
ncbi:unnamed protein product [Sphagnum balticum]